MPKFMTRLLELVAPASSATGESSGRHFKMSIGAGRSA
jgi:hypothetical protein